jgi:hypothetical protein
LCERVLIVVAMFGGCSCGGASTTTTATTTTTPTTTTNPIDAGAFVLVEQQGDVEIASGGGFERVAPQPGGRPLGGGARVRTGGAGSSALLRSPDGTEIALGDGVEMSIEEISATAQRIAVERGKLRAASSPGRTLTVDTSGARAQATGARFAIYASPHGLVAVAAQAGEVKLRARTREVSIVAGQQSIVPPRGEPTDPVAVPDSVFLQVAWPGETLQREHETTVRGRARAGERVLVNGVEAEVDAKGTFVATVRLHEGKNAPLRVEAEDLAGKRRALRGPALEVKSDLKLKVKPIEWGTRMNGRRAAEDIR